MGMTTNQLSAERLRTLLSYEPATGLFTRLVRTSSRSPAGSIAGSIYQTGYRMIGVDSVYYGAHRLAWLYIHGEWPVNFIDHINGIRDDNRIANLRDVSMEVNMQNLKRAHADNYSCGLLGATWDKMLGNWKAQIGFQGRTIYIGRFRSAEEAHRAYLSKKRQLHEGCTL